jgi:glycosyltransferase involved in cell wall biosynthesis
MGCGSYGVEKLMETQSKPGITVIFPAFNEAEGVIDQIRAARDALATLGRPFELVVVDDGSTDATAAAAERAGARVLQHVGNRGYGTALKTGIVLATYDTIVICDADGTYPADRIPDLVRELETADMVVGARIGPNVAIPLVRRPAKWLLGKLENHIAGRTIPDLNSGLRAFRRECVGQYLRILSNQFSFTTTVTLALLADDYEVRYLPIEYRVRIGHSKIRPRHFMDFVVLVLRMAMLFQPLRVFLPLAMLFGAAGILKVINDVVAFTYRTNQELGWSLLYQPVLSTSALLALMISLQLLLIGMVADGVLRRVAQSRSLVASRAVVVRPPATTAIEREFVRTGSR